MALRSKRVMVLSIDAGTWDIMSPMMGKGELPHMASIMRDGLSAGLISTTPSITPTAFASLLTGVNPGKHGIYHFYGNLHSNYTEANFLNYSDIPVKTIFDILTEQGRRIVSLAVPLAYPIRPDTKGAVVALRSIGSMKEKNIVIHPPELREELLKKLGGFDEGKLSHYLKEYGDLPKVDFYDRMVKKIHYLTDKLGMVIQLFVKEGGWDIFMVNFSITDVFQHMFWRFMDDTHISYDGELAPRYREVIYDAYRKIDDVIGEVLKNIDDETTLIVISDHGAAPLHRKFNVNRWLKEKGFLCLRSSRLRSRSFKIMYPTIYKILAKLGLTTLGEFLPKPIRQFKIPVIRTSPKSLSEMIDWSRTKAYFSAGGININLKGREPNGIVETSQEYEELLKYIRKELNELQDQVTGEKVTKVDRKEDLFSGPFVREATDLYISFREGFFCIPFEGTFKKDIFTVCPKDIVTGSKEEQVSGHHVAILTAARGILIIKGPDIRRIPEGGRDVRIIDLTPTLLYLLGVPIPEHMDGSLIRDFIVPETFEKNPPVMIKMENDGFLPAKMKETLSFEDEESVREQLRNLGYLE